MRAPLALPVLRDALCPGRAKRAPCASGTDQGPQIEARSIGPWSSRVYPTASSLPSVSPRSALRSPDTRVRSRGARNAYRWPCVPFTMSNSAVLFVPAARCCARVLSSVDRVHPRRGVGGAPTGALFLLSRLRDATGPRRVRRGASHDAGRSPLGAPPWRFSAGGRASISGIASGSVQRAPRSQVIMPGGRCPGPPEPAVTSRGRRTPLPAPPSGSSLEDAPP